MRLAGSPTVSLDAVSTALVPMIAAVVAVIAFFQYRTNELRRRHELFDSRMALYKATADFLSSISDCGDPDLRQIDLLIEEKVRSYFLYGKDVHDYIEHILDQALTLQEKNRLLLSETPLGADDQEIRKRHYKEQLNLWRWFSRESLRLPESAFKRYLKID